MPWPPCLLQLPQLFIAEDEVLEQLVQDLALLLELHLHLHEGALVALHFLLQGLSRNRSEHAAVSRRHAPGTCSSQKV